MSAPSEPRDPFGPTADPGSYVPRNSTERVLARLLRCVRDEDRPAALCGPPGLGKTLVLRLLASRLAYRFEGIYLPYGALPIAGLCAWALRQLGEWAEEDPRRALSEAAARRWAGGGGVLLLIDDANAMPVETARAVRELVSNAAGALRVVVASLDDERAAQVIAALGDDVETVRLDQPLNESECGAYLRARLEHAGAPPGARDRFDEATISKLYRLSEGVPRRLHEMADSVLREEPETVPAEEPPAARAGAERFEALALEAAADPSAGAELPDSIEEEEADEEEEERAPELLPRREPPVDVEKMLPPRARPGLFPLRRKASRFGFRTLARAAVIGVLLFGAGAMSWLLLEGLPVGVARTPEAPEAQLPHPEPSLERLPVAREVVEPTPAALPEMPVVELELEPVPESIIEPAVEPEPAPNQVAEPAVEPTQPVAPVEIAEPEIVEEVTQEIAEETVVEPVEAEPELIAEVEPALPTPVVVETVEPAVAALEATPSVAATEVASEVEATEPAEGAATPEPERVPVNINARPWAVIEVDGVEVGVTPLARVRLAEGPREIRARMPDGRVVERVVEVDADTRFIAFE